MNLTINMDNEIGVGAKYLFEHLEYYYDKILPYIDEIFLHEK